MKKLIVPALVAALLAPVAAYANGDPVISYSAIIRSSNPVPLKVTEVQIVKESLDIKLGIPFASVEATYILRNNSSKDLHIDYGFPVDYTGRKGEKPYFYGDPWNESLYEGGLRSSEYPDVFYFSLDDKGLPKYTSDEVLKEPEVYSDDEIEYTTEPVSRVWNYTSFDIPAGKDVKLFVRYSLLTCWSTPLYLYSMSPLSRYLPSYGQVLYDFTPSQHWGNGKVEDFTVTIFATGLPEYFLMDYNSPFIECLGLNFTRNGNIFKAQKKDFDLASATPLHISYWPEDYYFENHINPGWRNPIEECKIKKSSYTITAKAQDKYPASNLCDRDLNTAWVAPGDGKGAVIDIDFTTPEPVSDLAIYNGYHKSEALWKANSRVWKMKMEVTRADGTTDEPVEIDLRYSSPANYWLRDSAGDRFGEPTMLSVTDLQRWVYGRTKYGEDGEILSIPVHHSQESVTHIRLTVLSPVPGTKYSDLCISEIIPLDGFK